GACDFCAGEFRSVDATRDAQIVLSAITRTGERFGAVHVCDVVCGANTAKVRQFGHESLKTYGVGKDQPKSHWRSVLDSLIAERVVALADDGYAIPKLTPDAWEIMRGNRTFSRQEDTRIEPEKAARGAAAEDAPCHPGLFEHLRIVRKQIADAESVPPYVVLSDRTLRQMAAHMPSEDDELLQLHGVGAHKRDKYGKPFLEAIAAFLTENPEASESQVTLKTIARTAPKPADVNRPLGQTFATTLTLLQEGRTLEEIAEQRDMKVSTLHEHIVRIIEDGQEVDWKRLIPEDVVTLLHTLFEKHGSDSVLKPIIEEANGKADYGQAKIIRAVMARS
ncbi:MAG: RQC domain-containing protein, partial [Verrucomicrobiales bacterium]